MKVNSSKGCIGLTLPVWVAACARAATEALIGLPFVPLQTLEVQGFEETVEVPIASASAFACGHLGMGICYADSGLNLDLTNGLEIWTVVQWHAECGDRDLNPEITSDSWLQLIAGSGVGKFESSGEACLSEFAIELLRRNLRGLVPKGRRLRLEIIFPKGRELSMRTSNHAFGVVDGLALIGTQVEPQSSASPEQLQKTLEQLRNQCLDSEFSGGLTLVIGENGLDLALQLGLPSKFLLKTGNWLGPLIVAAADVGVKQLLLFGYHGKLIKLAGGIFHTHHHLADARLEVLTALALQEELPLKLIKSFYKVDSLEAALLIVEDKSPALAKQLWGRVAIEVEQRSVTYMARHGSWDMEIGAALFDRNRNLRWAGDKGLEILDVYGVKMKA